MPQRLLQLLSAHNACIDHALHFTCPFIHTTAKFVYFFEGLMMALFEWYWCSKINQTIIKMSFSRYRYYIIDKCVVAMLRSIDANQPAYSRWQRSPLKKWNNTIQWSHIEKRNIEWPNQLRWKKRWFPRMNKKILRYNFTYNFWFFWNPAMPMFLRVPWLAMRNI